MVGAWKILYSMEWIARELHADTKTVQHVFAKFDTLLSFCTQNGHIGFSPTLWTTITVFLKIIDRLKYDPKTWDTECKPSVTLTLQLTYSVPVMKCSRHFWHTYSNNVCFYSFIYTSYIFTCLRVLKAYRSVHIRHSHWFAIFVTLLCSFKINMCV